MVQCVVLKREAPGLERVPYPGELGRRIYESVSREGWARWLAHQTMLIKVSPHADRAQGAQVPGDGNGEVLLRGRLAGARRLSAAQGGELAACTAGRAATGGSGRACAPPRPLRCG